MFLPNKYDHCAAEDSGFVLREQKRKLPPVRHQVAVVGIQMEFIYRSNACRDQRSRVRGELRRVPFRELCRG